jgi:thiosulfate/3-mercaptopyruvate sulfurtransferase
VTHDRLKGRDIVDARASERYTGETEPVDPKAGHIPGAVNKPTSGNLDAEGRFLDPELLRARYSDVEADPVMSCGSGVTACHNALAMVVAGYQMPDVYIGSFSEWSNLDKPVAIGNNP